MPFYSPFIPIGQLPSSHWRHGLEWGVLMGIPIPAKNYGNSL